MKAIVENPDVSTAKTRGIIKTNAALVASSKTLLDQIGKEHVAKLKEKPKIVDAARKEIRDNLDALKKEVREPLTKWEDQKKSEKEARELKIETEKAHSEALQENKIFIREKELKAEQKRLENLENERLLKERIKEDLEKENEEKRLADLERIANSKAARLFKSS